METFWSGLFFKCPLTFTEFLKQKVGRTDVAAIEPRILEDGTEYFVVRVLNRNAIPTIYPDLFATQLYFDTFKIHVNVITINGDSTCFIDSLGWLNDERGKAKHFPSRIEATKAGIQKAFEIREAQLNQV